MTEPDAAAVDSTPPPLPPGVSESCLGSVVLRSALGVGLALILTYGLRLMVQSPTSGGAGSSLVAAIIALGLLTLSVPWSYWIARPGRLFWFTAIGLALSSAGVLVGAWRAGLYSLWTWPLWAFFMAAHAATLQLGQPTRRPQIRWASTAGALLLLAAAGLLMWFSPAAQVQQAHWLYRGTAVAILSFTVLRALLETWLEPLALDALRQRLAALLGWTLIGLITLSSLILDLLSQHSQVQENPGWRLGLIVLTCLLALAMVGLSRSRQRPRLVVLFCVVVAAQALRLLGVLGLNFLFLTALLGLLLPARRWLLALVVQAGLLALAAGNPAIPFELLFIHGLASSALVGLVLWLNHRVERFIQAHERGNDGFFDTFAGSGLGSPAIWQGYRIGAGVAVLVLVLGGIGLSLLYRQEQAHAQRENSQALHTGTNALLRLLEDAERITSSIAASHPEGFRNQESFVEQANQLLLFTEHGVALQWSPKGVVRFVHPLGGHEKAIGLDLLNDPAQRDETLEIVQTHRPRWSGPFNLRQGGLGMVYRLPVYTAAGEFSGFVSAVVRLPEVLQSLFQTTTYHLYRIALGPDPASLRVVFQSPGWTPQQEQLATPLRFPHLRAGSSRTLHGHAVEPQSTSADEADLWIDLAVASPLGTPEQRLPLRLQMLAGLAFLLGLLASALVRARRLSLNAQHDQQDMALLQGILAHSMASKALFERSGRLVWANPRASEIYHLSPEELLQLDCYSSALFRQQGWDELIRQTFEDGLLRPLHYQGTGSNGRMLDIQGNLSRVMISGEPYVIAQTLDMSELHAKERALQERALELQLATQAAGLGIWKMDLFSGETIWDAQMFDLHGVPADERRTPIEPERWRSHIHPEDLERVRSLWEVAQRAPSGHGTTLQYRIRRSDGSLAHIESSFQIELDDGLQPVRALGVNRDITARELARQEITQFRTHYQRLYEQSPDPQLTVDAASGQIIDCNAAMEQILRGTREQIIGATPDLLSPPLQPDGTPSAIGVRRKIEVSLQQGRLRFDWLHRRLDGEQFWAEVSIFATTINQRQVLLASWRDITRNKELAQELQRKTEQLDSILANTAVGVVHVRNRVIVWANPHLARMFGCELAELVGHDTRALYADTAGYEAMNQAYAAILEGTPSSADVRMQRRNGEAFWCRMSGRVLNPHSPWDGAIFVIEDINARIKAQQQIVNALRQAEEAAQSKSEFLSNMSHEIRTPLNGVLGLLQLLAHTRLDARQSDYVDKAYRTSRVLLNIINDILDLSRLDAQRLHIAARPFQLRAEVQSVVDTLMDSATTKGLTLRFVCEDGCPDWLSGDALRLHQVLLNLGNNAIKFTERGEVEIRIHYALVAGHSAALRFEVRDSGIGIDQAQIERIFERFTQVESGDRRRYGGSGLGLAICKGLIDAMGGDIGAESEPGRGSLFWFVLTLPLALAPPTAPPAATGLQLPPPDERPPLAGLRILLAEDQPINQLVLVEMLQLLGTEPVLADNGLEAVARVREAGAAPFDLVLMDVQMPVMDGLAATRELRRSHPDLPIIGVTAGVLGEDRHKCMEAGMTDFLPKPVSLQSLRDAVLQHCPAQDAEAAAPAPLPDPSQPQCSSAPPAASLPDRPINLPAAAAFNPADFDLDGAVQRLGGSRTMHARLVRHFLIGLDATHRDLQQQLDDSSVEGRQKAAHLLHGLRGSLLTLGATGLAERTRTIETALRSDQPPAPQRVRAELAAELAQVRACFVALLGEDPSPS